MLSLYDQVSRSRPVGRRDFMHIGGLGLAGLGLGGLAPQLASADLKDGNPTTGKSVIFLFQQGGPPQHETFDPKLDLPSEMATVGGDIATSVPWPTIRGQYEAAVKMGAPNGRRSQLQNGDSTWRSAADRQQHNSRC